MIPSARHAHTIQVPPERVRIEAHASLDSTNTMANRRAAEGAKAWTVIQAGEQHAGRGRRDKDWHSPLGNLYTSTILRPNCPTRMWPGLSFVVALAVGDTVARVAPSARARLKWPNDVLVGGAKISGILLETVLATGSTEGGAIIAGVGINIASFPKDTRYGAACLDALAGKELMIDRVLAEYMTALTHWYDIWSAEGFAPIRAAWLERAHGLGAEVEVSNVGAPSLRGRFTGITEDGRLLLELSDGVTEMISAGTLGFVEQVEA